jgi:hypothetical protein
VLPEKSIVVESVKRDSIRAGFISRTLQCNRYERPYSFSRSNCDFFGIISSICGASRGYVSTILFRMAR